MADLTKTDDGKSGIIKIINNDKGGGLAVLPFQHEIFLFDTYIAGTTHVKGILDLEPSLKVDDRLQFLREPYNEHDAKAIVIRNADGIKIGYVPMDDNAVFSRLMDAGKLLFGKISAKEIKGKWVKIDIKVFLQG